MSRRKIAVLAKLQRDVELWNKSNPVGCDVVVKLDGRDEPIETTTRSNAQILSGHSAVIWLNGVSGCYLLDRVRAATTIDEKIAARNELVRLFSVQVRA